MRAAVLGLIGLALVAGLAAGYGIQWGEPGGAGAGSDTVTTTSTTTSPVPAGRYRPMGPGMGGEGHESGPGYDGAERPMGGGPMGGSGMESYGSCSEIGEMGVGETIHWLLNNHYLFDYTVRVFEDNRTIVWTITGPNRTSVEVVYNHIRQMECVIENGGTPRAHDPLFVVDAQISSKYVETMLKFINDTTLRVVKVADNDCAFEVIKLHAEVVRGFFDTGRAEAMQIHEVPESVLQACEPYLEEPGGTP